MLSWASILYGAALSAVVAGVALAILARSREPVVILTGVLATAAGPLAWNAVLRATHASQFFTDAPLRLLPASWQDTGSGVFALATAAALLGLGPLATRPARRTIGAGRAVRPGRVPGRRLPVLTNRSPAPDRQCRPGRPSHASTPRAASSACDGRVAEWRLAAGVALRYAAMWSAASSLTKASRAEPQVGC